MPMIIFVFGPDKLHGRAEFSPPFVGDGSFEVGEDVEDEDGNVEFDAVGRYSFGLGFEDFHIGLDPLAKTELEVGNFDELCQHIRGFWTIRSSDDGFDMRSEILQSLMDLSLLPSASLRTESMASEPTALIKASVTPSLTPITAWQYEFF